MSRIVGKCAFGLAALFAVSLPAFAESGAPPHADAKAKIWANRLYPYIVKEDKQGRKTVIYPLTKHGLDRLLPTKTDPNQWQQGSPMDEVTCYTYHGTGSNGDICGVKCDDNTYYSIDCGADIFGDGFDIEFQY